MIGPTPLGPGVLSGTAGPTDARPTTSTTAGVVGPAAGHAALRLQGVVLAAPPEGAIVQLASRTVLLEGAPALRPGTQVTVQVPAGQVEPAAEPTAARLLLAGDGSTASFREGFAVRLLPAEAPATLDARAGPALPAVLSAPGSPAAAVRVSVVVTPAEPDGAGPPTTGLGLAAATGTSMPIAATLDALATGTPVAALVLPRAPGATISLSLDDGLLLRFEDAAVDLPRDGQVSVRLADPGRPEVAALGSLLRRALSPRIEEESGRDDVAGPTRLAPDARLAARLGALADALGQEVDAGPSERAGGSTRQSGADPGAQSSSVVALLGEPEWPRPLRLARDRDPERPGGRGEETDRLSLDVTFGQLGRIRLDIDRSPTGELRITLRGERSLPGPVRAGLIDLVGAAFELGGTRAWFLLGAGELPPLPPRTTTIT